MKDYSKMSDAEIVMRVACSVDGIDVDYNGIPKLAVDCYMYNSANSIKWLRTGSDEFDFFNPCNNPSDAWPIIRENRISLRPDDMYDGAPHSGYWRADNELGNHCHNENPPRAAMIVYLMMKDEEK